MCVDLEYFVGDYEWACVWIWNNLIEIEYVALHDDFPDLVWVNYDWESGTKSAKMIWS